MLQPLLLCSHLPLSSWCLYLHSSFMSVLHILPNVCLQIWSFLCFWLFSLKYSSSYLHCVDHCLHSSTQLFSNEFYQLILNALTGSMKFPPKDNIDPETSTSSNLYCLGKTLPAQGFTHSRHSHHYSFLTTFQLSYNFLALKKKKKSPVKLPYLWLHSFIRFCLGQYCLLTET